MAQSSSLRRVRSFWLLFARTLSLNLLCLAIPLSRFCPPSLLIDVILQGTRRQATRNPEEPFCAERKIFAVRLNCRRNTWFFERKKAFFNTLFRKEQLKIRLSENTIFSYETKTSQSNRECLLSLYNLISSHRHLLFRGTLIIWRFNHVWVFFTEESFRKPQ